MKKYGKRMPLLRAYCNPCCDHAPSSRAAQRLALVSAKNAELSQREVELLMNLSPEDRARREQPGDAGGSPPGGSGTLLGATKRFDGKKF